MSTPGYLVYHREGTLMAQPFDAERIRLTGEPVPIAEGLQFNAQTARAAFTVSENGVLAYRAGTRCAPAHAGLGRSQWDRTAVVRS